MGLNATFNSISVVSLQSVLMMEETLHKRQHYTEDITTQKTTLHRRQHYTKTTLHKRQHYTEDITIQKTAQQCSLVVHVVLSFV
jgi:glyoxylate carboligase